MKLDDLKPADYNPRSMTDRAREGLRASLERFGCVQHIVWNRRTKRVVGGHQRLTALLDLGEKETDVVVVSFTAKEERALNVALNNQAIQGEWTDDLESLLAGIQTDTPDLYADILLDELAEEQGITPPDFQPGSIDDQGKLDEKAPTICPECGHEWTA